MQCYTRRLVSKVIQIPMAEYCNHYMYQINKRTSIQESKDNDLICPEWEEAIIKEHRTPDVPLDLMQKETIERIHKNAYSHQNGYELQSNLDVIDELSK